MGIFEWLWSLLPDECMMEDCAREGVRGNENIIYRHYTHEEVIMCDYCHSDYLHQRGLELCARRKAKENE